MCSLKEATLVAELEINYKKLDYHVTGSKCGKVEKYCEKNEDPKKNLLTTLPGFRLDRRHVDVSVVQQLKHRRRTRSLNFVDASSV